MPRTLFRTDTLAQQFLQTAKGLHTVSPGSNGRNSVKRSNVVEGFWDSVFTNVKRQHTSFEVKDRFVWANSVDLH